MSFTEPTDDITAVLTTRGREEMARLICGQCSIQISSYQVGRGGYNPSNPVKIVPVDVNATGLADPVPDASSRRSFEIIEQPIGNNVVAPVCRLDPGGTDVEYGLGELGIFATWLYDIVYPAQIGDDFLFAIAHFPLVSKTPTHTFVWRVVIAL